MELRFEPAPQSAYDLLNKVKKDIQFHQLLNANILMLMDTKKRTLSGKLAFASLSKTNDIERFLSVDDIEVADGYDYIMRLDSMLWHAIEDQDRIRILRHELCHADVDVDSDTPFKIQPHEVEDFYSEIEFNKDDPRWMQRMAAILDVLYNPE
ncbi:MAG: putative metallopeptidase [Desulfatirhabdiaceae bacterium]